jgi:hypothetical protein
MGTQPTPIDERHFRPDPEGKRMFVLHGWPAADIGIKREFDLARRQAATSNASVSESRVPVAAVAVLS